jgi:hypothetical protein
LDDRFKKHRLQFCIGLKRLFGFARENCDLCSLWQFRFENYATVNHSAGCDLHVDIVPDRGVRVDSLREPLNKPRFRDAVGNVVVVDTASTLNGRTNDEVAAEIIAFRRRFPHMGPRKIISRLAELYPDIEWPASGTPGDILRGGSPDPGTPAPNAACTLATHTQ